MILTIATSTELNSKTVFSALLLFFAALASCAAKANEYTRNAADEDSKSIQVVMQQGTNFEAPFALIRNNLADGRQRFSSAGGMHVRGHFHEKARSIYFQENAFRYTQASRLMRHAECDKQWNSHACYLPIVQTPHASYFDQIIFHAKLSTSRYPQLTETPMNSGRSALNFFNLAHAKLKYSSLGMPYNVCLFETIPLRFHYSIESIFKA